MICNIALSRRQERSKSFSDFFTDIKIGLLFEKQKKVPDILEDLQKTFFRSIESDKNNTSKRYVLFFFEL